MNRSLFADDGGALNTWENVEYVVKKIQEGIHQVEYIEWNGVLSFLLKNQKRWFSRERKIKILNCNCIGIIWKELRVFIFWGVV